MSPITIIQSIKNYIKNLFLTGLLFLLPIAITFSLFSFSLNLILSWLVPLRKLEIPFLEAIPYYEVILVVLFIFSVGVFLKAFILKPFIQFIEDVFAQIPLIRTVYFGAKQLIQAFSGQDQASFKEVVYVEFPRAGVYSVGFLTSKVPKEIAPNKEITYYNIYIPTTPNPTTGYFVMFPAGQFKHTDLNRQEAMALIISGGILQPERYSDKN